MRLGNPSLEGLNAMKRTGRRKVEVGIEGVGLVLRQNKEPEVGLLIVFSKGHGQRLLPGWLLLEPLCLGLPGLAPWAFPVSL
jgi:hypothetical protein